MDLQIVYYIQDYLGLNKVISNEYGHTIKRTHACTHTHIAYNPLCPSVHHTIYLEQ